MHPRDMAALGIVFTLLVFIVCSAIITVLGVGIDGPGLAFWKEWLMAVTGGLIGYISGLNTPRSDKDAQ